MAKAKNRVVAGDYTGMAVGAAALTPYIITGFVKSFNLDKQTVESYEVITDEHRKSAASGVTSDIVGGVLLGPVGVLAGELSAKNKDIYQIAINFKDGKRSLIEVDDKIYKAIVKSCF